ncbi:MAG: hypothetical protein CMP49_04755 [Flavobacteriales bacterium]|jgi:NADH:ubiquinone oxidoreductase subunit 6 (subunit J)|nr:hypothetical protein [Flavobacteriales bacterium]|tara:strand:- start:1932 stop:2273 length:342 start_codon:yes stop_codon:yes gene_type:complete
MVDFGLILTYLLISITILACIASPIIQIKNDMNKIKQMITPVFFLSLIIITSILISSDEVLPNYTDANGQLISSNLSKIVGGSLITFYILSFITICAILYSEFLYKIFNNGKK